MDSLTLGNILYISRAFGNCRLQLIPEELRPSDALFISYIHRHPGCTQDQIVKFTGMDKTTVAHRLNKLEEKGYVTREVSAKDARKRLCCPTEKGENIYPVIHDQYVTFKKGLLESFSAEELALLDSFTNRMKKNAEDMLREADKKQTDEELPEGQP